MRPKRGKQPGDRLADIFSNVVSSLNDMTSRKIFVADSIVMFLLFFLFKNQKKNINKKLCIAKSLQLKMIHVNIVFNGNHQKQHNHKSG